MNHLVYNEGRAFEKAKAEGGGTNWETRIY